MEHKGHHRGNPQGWLHVLGHHLRTPRYEGCQPYTVEGHGRCSPTRRDRPDENRRSPERDPRAHLCLIHSLYYVTQMVVDLATIWWMITQEQALDVLKNYKRYIVRLLEDVVDNNDPGTEVLL